MANSLFSRPRSTPTAEKIRKSELAKFWFSTSYYLGRQLALYQAVSIPELGAFTLVREHVVNQQNNVVLVERPVFHLAKALAQDHDLRYDYIDVAGHDEYQQLPYDEIASETGISEGAARLCVQRTVCQFSACIGKRQNVAFVWWDVGMLLIEGKRVQMKFYEDFLGKLSGTAEVLQALLGMPEMSKAVISRNACAASLTASGHVTVFPMYTHEIELETPDTAKVDLKYHVKTRRGQGWAIGRKGDLCETRLLHRAALPPKRLPPLTGMRGRDQAAEEKEPRTRQLPAIPRRSLPEKEEQAKVVPLVGPRMVDFFAIAREKKRMADLEAKALETKKGKVVKGQNVRKEEEKGKNVRKEREAKKVKEVKPVKPVKPVKQVKPVKPVKEVKPVKPVKEVKPVKPVKPVKQVKPVKEVKQEKKVQEKKLPKVTQKKQQQKLQGKKAEKGKQQKSQEKDTEAEPEEVKLPAAQETSVTEEEYSISLSGSETERSSSTPSLRERMMGKQEEAEEEPRAVFWDSAALPKRKLSSRTDEALREVVKLIVGQVSREQQGQRDAEKDLQDRLQSELAVLWWSRPSTHAPGLLHLPGAEHRPAPPAGPKPEKASRRVVRRVVVRHVDEDHERSSSSEILEPDIH
ncbi:coiled-coil domain-containing protein 81-like [Lagopus muta]|uniref:coiled-coil domain-containing protein 81-like n=1 Tax=Lagopus muta TaxID=64668 RepID=UPI00209F25A6|nr:coiled-coil domain-containing protein 81-like [Lagopus muta]